MGASSGANLTRGAVLVLAGLSLAACAGVGPRYPAPMHGHGGGYAERGPDASGKPPSKYSGYHVGKPYEINGRWYYPAEQPDYDEVGTASWYGEQFHNHYTADGEVFDMNIPTAAHKTLPLPCLVEVTNLDNGRSMVLRVNDRGPFVGDRLIDLSKEAAIELGYYGKGVTQVRVRYVGPAPDAPGGATLYQAKASPPPPRRPRDTAVQVASAPAALLGSDIDDRPLQSSPSTMSWNAAPAPVAPKGPPPQAPPVQNEVPLPAPSPVPTPQPTSDIDALLNQLAAEGAPAPPAASVAQAPSAVQVGAYSSRANAERAAAGLQGQTQIVPVEQSGRILYKVMVAQ